MKSARMAFLLPLVLAAALVTGQPYCPSNCICVKEYEVSCEGGTLSTIPPDLSRSLRDLRIVGNNITELVTDQFRRYTELRTLYLENTNIHKIHPHAFRGLTKLRHLVVQRNPLRSLDSNSLSDLNNVKEVSFSQNQVAVVHRNAFAGSRHINTLTLERNPIERLESRAFAGVFDLHFLYLPESIAELEEDVFNGMENVHFIHLPGLRLKHLNPHTFRGLRSVKSIKIIDSHLGVIKPNAFAGIQSVEYIEILRCEIRKLRKKSFSGMHYVGHLNLRKNTIHRWEPGTLSDLPNQNVLNVELKLNSFDCVCRNFWWLTQDSQYRLSPAILIDNHCGTPRALAGDSLAQLNSSYLATCSKTAGDYDDYDSTAPLSGSSPPPSTLPFATIVVSLAILFKYS